MQRERRVGVTAPVALILAALVLATCSSDPPPGENLIAPLSSAPVTLPRLTGGQAMKAFIDPLTGELRSPAEVDATASERAGARLPATALRRSQVLETQSGGSVRPVSSRTTGQLHSCPAGEERVALSGSYSSASPQNHEPGASRAAP